MAIPHARLQPSTVLGDSLRRVVEGPQACRTTVARKPVVPAGVGAGLSGGTPPGQRSCQPTRGPLLDRVGTRKGKTPVQPSGARRDEGPTSPKTPKRNAVRSKHCVVQSEEVRYLPGWTVAHAKKEKGKKPAPEPAKGLRNPRDEWRGFWRFRTVAVNLAEAGSFAGDPLKIDLLEQMRACEASCFWRACVWAMHPNELRKFEKVFGHELVQPKDGISGPRAQELLQGFRIGIYAHNEYDGTVDVQKAPADAKKAFGVMHVLLDDKGRFDPHWLPVRGPVEGGRMQYTADEWAMLASLGEERWRVGNPYGSSSHAPDQPTGNPSSSESSAPDQSVASSVEMLSVIGSDEEDEDEPQPRPMLGNGTDPRAARREQRRERRRVQAERAAARAAGLDTDVGQAMADLERLAGYGCSQLPLRCGNPHCAWARCPVARRRPTVHANLTSDVPYEGMGWYRVNLDEEPDTRETRGPLREFARALRTEREMRLPAFDEEGTQPEHLPFCPTAYGEEAPPVLTPGPCGFLTRWCGGKSCELPDGVARSQTRAVRFALDPMGWVLDRFFPRLLEARASVLIGAAAREGDWVYARVRENDPLDLTGRRMVGGALRLETLLGLSGPGARLCFGPVQVLEVGPVSYELARLQDRVGEPHAVQGLVQLIARYNHHRLKEVSHGIRGWMLRYKTREVQGPDGSLQVIPGPLVPVVHGLDWLAMMWRKWLSEPFRVRRRLTNIDVPVHELRTPGIANLQHLPDAESKVRAMYAMLKSSLPDWLQGIFLDARGPHLALNAPALLDPVVVARDMLGSASGITGSVGITPAFSTRTGRHPAACVSCRRDPPNGKYRWKHRVCNECDWRLKRCGYVTPAGAQVQDNLKVPTCYPGIVLVPGEQYPPPPSKFAGVDVHGGEPGTGIQVCWQQAQSKKLFTERGKKWVDMEKEDLARLIEPTDPRFSIALAGIGLSGARPMVSAQTNYNRAKAVMGRVFRQQTPAAWGVGPKPGVWRWVRQFVPLILGDLRAAAGPPMSVADWLDSMPARRKAPLRRAAEMYERRGLLRSDRKFQAFVKSECLPGFSQDKAHGELERLPAMLDRLIQAPTEITHVIAGPVLKPFMKGLKKCWHKEHFCVYGGAEPEVLHRFLQRICTGERTYFWCDFSMYDNTHSDDTWAFMEWLYGRQHPDFHKVMNMWRRPEGSIGPFKYKASVMNSSGRDDTALANAVLNGFATTLSIIAALLAKPLMSLTCADVERWSADMVLSVCGDDSLGALPVMSGERLAKFKRDVASNIRMFGFESKLEVSNDLRQAVYLGCRPYPTKQGWFWGRTIGRASYKMGWVRDPLQKDVMAHITGVADMHCLCSRHVPILSDLAQKIVALRQGAKRTPVVLDENRPWEWTYKSGVAYDDVTIQAVAEVYSATAAQPVSSADIKRLISIIAGIKQLPAVVEDPTWALIVATDDL